MADIGIVTAACLIALLAVREVPLEGATWLNAARCPCRTAWRGAGGRRPGPPVRLLPHQAAELAAAGRGHARRAARRQVRPGAGRPGSRSDLPEPPPAPVRGRRAGRRACRSCTTTTTSWWSTSRSAWRPTPAPAGPARPWSARSPAPATGSPPRAPPSGRASCTGSTSAPPALMVVAKSERAYTVLKQAFQDRDGREDLPRGRPGAPRSADGHHRRAHRPAPDPGLQVGRWSPAARRASPTTRRSRPFRPPSLLEVHLETGRTHQIRVHFSALRHPCVGDLTYGADPTLAARLGLTRQWLHAVRWPSSTPATGAGWSSPAPTRTTWLTPWTCSEA